LTKSRSGFSLTIHLREDEAPAESRKRPPPIPAHDPRTEPRSPVPKRMVTMTTNPVLRPWRRYLRFSIRGLIVLVLFSGGGLGWLVHSARNQRGAAAAITAAGGSVQYDWEWRNGNVYPAAKPWVPDWLVDRVGIDYFGHVTQVSFYGSAKTDSDLTHIARLTQLERLSLTGSPISEAGLAHLSNLRALSRLDLDYTPITDAGLMRLTGLNRLSVLVLNGTQVTDTGLAHLTSLTNLAELNIAGTQVTDAGLAQLKGLRNLTILNVAKTQITDAGARELKQALPGLTIYR
jgi:Leucine Rich repeat